LDRTIYAIQIRSLEECLEHLKTLDLPGMEILALAHGTDRERRQIAAVRKFLATLS
jgi:hypothetical protein